MVRGRPGVSLPEDRVALRSPTEDDLRLLDGVLGAGIDAVAVSFVHDADDVATIRRVVGSDGPMVVAKIETGPAVADLDDILHVADGVMVARGDLGVRLPLEDVPHIQKQIIRTGVAHGKPVITATQMLESMITAPTPTRAEVSDVANAVFDGTSAVMLSAETAIGVDPVAVVDAMARITSRAERDFDYRGWGTRLGEQQLAGLQRRAHHRAHHLRHHRGRLAGLGRRRPGGDHRLHQLGHHGAHDQPLPSHLSDHRHDAVRANGPPAVDGLGDPGLRDVDARHAGRDRVARRGDGERPRPRAAG